MDQIMREKNIQVSNEEQETKLILYKLMKHLKDIKTLRNSLEKLKAKKHGMQAKKEELIKIYQKRHAQIKVIMQLAQINKIQKYAKALNAID